MGTDAVSSVHITLSEALILNLPGFSFLALWVPAVILYRLSLPGLLGLLPVIPATWGLSGFMLLLYDYEKKKKKAL